MSSSAKITFKNMDYFKFKKYILDSTRDETGVCSKEVTSLCACVQTLWNREVFKDENEEWSRFEEIFSGYKQILSFKRVESVDVRIKSGWWGEQKSGLSVGKIKISMLKEVLVAKAKEWADCHDDGCYSDNIEKDIDGPGIYVFKHKKVPCFQLVQWTGENIFNKCSELFKNTFDASYYSPISSLLIVSFMLDWSFYFIPVENNEEEIRVMENDTILKHDSIWPHGLNLSLKLENSFDFQQFRVSCLRHRWPPEQKQQSKQQPINIKQIKQQIKVHKNQEQVLKQQQQQHAKPKTPRQKPQEQQNSKIPESKKSSPKSESPNSPTTPSPRPNSARHSSSSSSAPVTSRPSTAHAKHLSNMVSFSNPETKKNNHKPIKQEIKKPTKIPSSLKKDNSMGDIEVKLRMEAEGPSFPTSSEVKKAPSSTFIAVSQSFNGAGDEEIKSNIETKEKNFEIQKDEKTEKDKTNVIENEAEQEEEEEVSAKPLTNGDEEPQESPDKPVKRSGTFTYSDTEEDHELKETPANPRNLPRKALMAAKELAKQNN